MARKSGIQRQAAPDSSQFRKGGNKVYIEHSLVPYVRKKGKDEEQGHLPSCTLKLHSIELLEEGNGKYNFERPRRKRWFIEQWSVSVVRRKSVEVNR